ncbi:MAG: SDR family NAD(P)-dependent oxidoreductase [Deltaproteobacteria bacterium]|nr:SDR family NAD(P)-dependent oxidoreductase [Deltaproteobacteria bacterium]
MDRPLILVTGASDGIGLETARQLAKRGADVIVHGRRAERVEAARADVERQAGRAMPKPVVADLSSLRAVAALAKQLDSTGVHPTVLVNNAGVYMRELALTVDGIETTMAVNHFAPFLLTQSLLAHEGSKLDRIVNVSSVAHSRGSIDLADITFVKRRFTPYGAYAASKLANVVFTIELAKRLAGRAAVNALHPGVVSTKLLTEGFGVRGSDSLEEASATSVFLALDEKVRSITGEYFVARRKSVMNPEAKDAAFAKSFFELSEEVVRAALARAAE